MAYFRYDAWEVDTLRERVQSVSCCLFHSEQDLIFHNLSIEVFGCGMLISGVMFRPLEGMVIDSGF